MALDLNKLTEAIEALGNNAVKRAAEISKTLPAAHATLKAIAADPDELNSKFEKARHFRWAGAVPTTEAVDAHFKCPPHPARVNIVGADGSQIYPDRHAIALYYVLNTGSIVFRHGADEAPLCFSNPEIFYNDEDLYEEESLISTVKINAERDVRELGELARLGAQESAAAPTVTLLDNGLLLYFSLQDQDRKAKDRAIENYIDQLDRLKESGAVVAGVVDRPRAANVVRMLHLATLDDDEINAENLRGVGAFQHFTDALVFRDLAPGERSAVFVNASPDNLERYQPRGQLIHFFYLNVGRVGAEAILRVEIPKWVLANGQVDLVQAAIMEQCRFSDGFPYVLMRAHELAVITQEEKRAFEELVMGALVQRGFVPMVSHKQQGKIWTSSGKKRYP